MILGGGQEHSYRLGTSQYPIARWTSCSCVSEARSLEPETIRSLRDSFEARLLEAFAEAVIHSRHAARLPNTSYFSLPGTFGEDMAELLAGGGIIVGTGPACSAGAIRSSKTLRSMGVPHQVAAGALRVSLSRFSSIQEITDLLVNLTAIYQRTVSARNDGGYVSMIS